MRIGISLLLGAVLSTLSANAHQIVTPIHGLPNGWIVVENERSLKIAYPLSAGDTTSTGLTALVCKAGESDRPMVFVWLDTRWKEFDIDGVDGVEHLVGACSVFSD